MTTVAIIQARMSSSRFPGKHLAPLAGRPMISRVIERVLASEVDKIVLATSDQWADESLAGYVSRAHREVDVFRGSESNPLERTYLAAVEVCADHIVRVTGDCPLVDSRVITAFAWSIKENDQFDYVGATNSPDGTDVEAFTMQALRMAYDHAEPKETEHTTTWIRKNMKCVSNESDPKYTDVHYSVNTVEDLKLCERMLEMCGDGARWQDHVEAYRKIKNG